MMNKLHPLLASLLLSSTLLSTNTVAADSSTAKHCSHDHNSHAHHDSSEPKAPAAPVNAEQASEAAKARIADLVKTQAIDSSWAAIAPTSVEKIVRKHDPAEEQQWQITFINKAIANSDRQTLYVFLGLDGSFRTTNYTGR